VAINPPTHRELRIVSNAYRHLRSLLIAIVALTMSAGLASAAHPAADRHSNTVSNANTTETSESDESTETSESETETSDETSTETSDETSTETSTETSSDSAGDNCTTDPTGLSVDELAALSHGSIVCWAAQQATPDGWDNHGAWVSSWARMNHGADASAAGKAKGAAGKAKGHSHRS
jgi:cytoskeletal protein RodZ